MEAEGMQGRASWRSYHQSPLRLSRSIMPLPPLDGRSPSSQVVLAIRDRAVCPCEWSKLLAVAR
jgi:hypothetical protein